MQVVEKHSCRGIILMLHRLIERECEYGSPGIARLHVTVRHLEKLMLQLRELGYEIISLDELHSTLMSGGKNSRFAAFTFDDAYRDTYELALPLFRKHTAPFAVYVPTAVPDWEFFWWYYMLDDLVFRNDVIDVPIGGERRRFDLGTLQQKQQAYAVLESLINGFDAYGRREALEAAFEQYGLDPDSYARKLSMTWDQIRELDRSGLATIGNHSVNHINLSLMSREGAFEEMKRGKCRIEEQIGHSVDHFCYPFGAVGRREFNLAGKLGFKTCTTCRPGCLTGVHRSYLDRLPRIMVEETTSACSLAG
jgi:peptidoglycan/xylan/chitin deacetylase (PgdA/CDA1 family)